MCVLSLNTRGPFSTFERNRRRASLGGYVGVVELIRDQSVSSRVCDGSCLHD